MQRASLPGITQMRPGTRGHEASELHLSSFGRILLWAFAIYLVVPLVDVPLMGLSPSAFFIVLVAMEVFLRKRNLRLEQFKIWYVLIYFLWLGLLLSIVGNVLAGNISAGSTEYVRIVRATFWLASFVTTMVIVTRLPISQLRLLIILLGAAVIVLGWVRLYEGIVFGRWGGSTSRIMTQNGYGVIFSRFVPFALALPFVTKGIRQQWTVLAIMTLLIAIAANGSRSSWIAVMLGLVTFSMLYAYSQPRRSGNLLGFIVVLLVILTIAVAFLPFEVLEPISTRFATFESVEDDRSFVTRQIMVQKSLLLFEGNPLFGAGLGQFSQTYVDLEIPANYARPSLDRLNSIASHNAYAKHLGETGLVGTIPFVLLMAVLVFRGLRAAIELARRGEIWAIAIFASFAGQGVHMWTIDNLGNTAPWFIYGLLAGVIERSRHIPEVTTDA